MEILDQYFEVHLIDPFTLIDKPGTLVEEDLRFIEPRKKLDYCSKYFDFSIQEVL